jgi:hypothetical protein
MTASVMYVFPLYGLNEKSLHLIKFAILLKCSYGFDLQKHHSRSLINKLHWTSEKNSNLQ